ncbi:hypothetical protein GCM10027612_07470 [Microbispora bryophytorum subsp. camponoti]
MPSSVDGLVLMVPAYHAAMAFTLEEVRGPSVFPIRIGKACGVTKSDISEDVKGAEHQPGVRKQL